MAGSSTSTPTSQRPASGYRRARARPSGFAGLTLGGGIGVLARAWGLSCDNLTAAEVVTADGRVRRCDPDRDGDLFWACRGGGGGSFGVVTSFTFRTRPAPEISAFYLRWPLSAAAEVVAAWQWWVAAAEPSLWSTCKLASAPGSAGRVIVAGTWIGPPDALAGVPACHLSPKGRLERERLAGTSHLVTAPLDGATIATAVARVRAAADVPGLVAGGMSLDSLGGSVGDVPAGATAFVHRDALFSVQYTAVWA